MIILLAKYVAIYHYECEGKTILYIPIHESDLVHNTKGEVFDRNVDGEYKVTSLERIANIYMFYLEGTQRIMEKKVSKSIY